MSGLDGLGWPTDDKKQETNSCSLDDLDPLHVTRRAFVCVGCYFVYCDDPPTSCDCMQDPPKFIQGEINYFLEGEE